jgi:DNA-binding MarR family transcriptional regulator
MGKSTIPRPGEGKRGPEGHLGYLVRQANVAIRSALDQALAGTGVTTPQFSVLTMIAAYPGVSGAELARLTFLTPQTINVIVHNLERAGTIAKSADPTHGRILKLEATRRGHTLLKRCRARVQAVEARLVRSLSKADKRAVRRWLASVGATLA